MMRQAPNAAGVQKTAVNRWPVDAALTPVQPSPSLPQSLPSPPDPLTRAWRERGKAWGAVLTGKQWRWCPSRSSAIILSGTGRRVRSWGEAGDWQRFRAGLCGWDAPRSIPVTRGAERADRLLVVFMGLVESVFR